MVKIAGTTSRFRRPQFSLLMMLIIVTVASVWLGWKSSLVHQRIVMRRQIRENGGLIRLSSGTEAPLGYDQHGKRVIDSFSDLAGSTHEIPIVQQWLGDEAAHVIELTSDEQINPVKSVFPEASVIRGTTDWVVTGDVSGFDSAQRP